MVSIVICTYNRSEIIKECIQSIIKIKQEADILEVLIIDNNSTDNTFQIVSQFQEKYSYVNYVSENKQGLSFARNTGYKKALYDWVLYLDDDAVVDENFIKRLKFLIFKTDLKCVGGVYLPWYKYGKPKWFKDKYASNKKRYKDLSILKGNEFASGGVLLINKELLIKFNGFSSNFGMNGNITAYGEEDDLQQRLRENNIKIGYDPFLVIYHLVPKHKLSISWFIKSSYKKGFTFLQALGYPHNKLTGFFSLLICVSQVMIFSVIKLFNFYKKEYYLNNFLIDVFKKPAKWFGVFISSWIKK